MLTERAYPVRVAPQSLPKSDSTPVGAAQAAGMPLALIHPALRFIRLGVLRPRRLTGGSFATVVTPSYAAACKLPVEPAIPLPAPPVFIGAKSGILPRCSAPSLRRALRAGLRPSKIAPAILCAASRRTHFTPRPRERPWAAQLIAFGRGSNWGVSQSDSPTRCSRARSLCGNRGCVGPSNCAPPRCRAGRWPGGCAARPR